MRMMRWKYPKILKQSVVCRKTSCLNLRSCDVGCEVAESLALCVVLMLTTDLCSFYCLTDCCQCIWSVGRWGAWWCWYLFPKSEQRLEEGRESYVRKRQFAECRVSRVFQSGCSVNMHKMNQDQGKPAAFRPRVLWLKLLDPFVAWPMTSEFLDLNAESSQLDGRWEECPVNPRLPADLFLWGLERTRSEVAMVKQDIFGTYARPEDLCACAEEKGVVSVFGCRVLIDMCSENK